MTERLILGTAGHIDHGKTTLIRALTGVDCDRLPEEKTRGITIELGFAPMDLPSGLRLGIVDVPGHERLVRTMVSGATGIDLVLFVVAADEGIMPQSREHLAICDLLGVKRGVIALTKIDAVDAELAELARLDVEETIQGSCLAGAPVVPVSATTGEGLPELRAALERIARGSPPRTIREGAAWLPVDRVFTMRGFGTVVTGTLRGGTFEEGAPAEVFPEGGSESFPTRVRGLQMHGEATKRVLPGSRCAMNLHGVEVQSVPRGSVVATPGRLAYRARVDVEIRLLPGAARLKDGGALTVHVGTAERLARVRLLDRARLEPGDHAFAELRFATPLVIVEGERFIARGFARTSEGAWTIGGGHVLDVAPVHARRARTTRLGELETLAGEDRTAALAVRLRRAGVRGVEEETLLREVRSIEGIPGVRIAEGHWMDRDAFDELREKVVAAVEAQHRSQPLEPTVGLASIVAELDLKAPESALRAALDAAVEADELESETTGYRRPGHRVQVADPEESRRIVETIRGAGLAPPTIDALARTIGQEPRQLRPLLEHLVREGELVRVTSDLFFSRPAIEDLRDRVTAYLREQGSIDPAAYKELTGQTRKHTVPLMEFFDAEKVTLRRGNVRLLRGT
jgi:selenocysteine-specific elongation factor